MEKYLSNLLAIMLCVIGISVSLYIYIYSKIIYKKRIAEINKILTLTDIKRYKAEDNFISELYKICLESERYRKNVEVSLLQEKLYSLVAETGFIKLIPNLFVAVGLLLTFIGLSFVIANAGELISSGTGNQIAEVNREKFTEMLKNMSFSFRISMAGIFTSIISSIVVTVIKKHENTFINSALSLINRLSISFSLQNNLSPKEVSEQDYFNLLRNINDTLVRHETIAKETKETLDFNLNEKMQNSFIKIDTTLSNLNNSNILINKSINSLNEMNSSFKEVSDTLIQVNNTSQNSLTNFENKMGQINLSIESYIYKTEEYSKNNIEEFKNQINLVKKAIEEIISNTSEKNILQSKEFLDGHTKINDITSKSIASLVNSVSELTLKLPSSNFDTELKEFNYNQNQSIRDFNKSIIDNTNLYKIKFEDLTNIFNKKLDENINFQEKILFENKKLNEIINKLPDNSLMYNKLFDINESLETVADLINNSNKSVNLNIEKEIKDKIENINNNLSLLKDFKYILETKSKPSNNSESMIVEEIRKSNTELLELKDIFIKQNKILNEINIKNSTGLFQRIFSKKSGN